MATLPEQTASKVWNSAGQPVPTDVKAIAEAQGLHVVTHQLDNNVSGVLIVDESVALIGVNEAHHENRQRFSIAHELGHWFLHRDTAQVFVDQAPVFFRDTKSSEGTTQQEIEANQFAAELLMPASSLRERVAVNTNDAFDEDLLQAMAAEYGVSVQALTIRLARLGLIGG